MIRSRLVRGRVIRGRVIRSRFGVIDRGRVVRSGLRMIRSGLGVIRSGFGSGVVRSGLGVIRSGSGLGVVGFVDGFALVFDIGDISVFVISSVCDDLGTAVGKGNAVFAGDNTVVVLGFLFGEISTRVFILNSILVGEGPGGKFVLRSMMRGRVIRGRLGVIRSRGGVIRGGVIGGGGIGAISHSHGQHRGQH